MFLFQNVPVEEAAEVIPDAEAMVTGSASGALHVHLEVSC